MRHFQWALILLAVAGCNGAKKSASTNQFDGFYVSSDPTSDPLPLAAIASDSSSTRSYGVLQGCGNPEFGSWGSVGNYDGGVIPGSDHSVVGAGTCSIRWNLSPDSSGLTIRYTKNGSSGVVTLSRVERVDFLKVFKGFTFSSTRSGIHTTQEDNFCNDLVGMSCTSFFAL